MTVPHLRKGGKLDQTAEEGSCRACGYEVCGD